MSVYTNRMIRQMYKDIYLPVWCHAPTKETFYSILGECKCLTECKYRDPQPVKDPKSK